MRTWTILSELDRQEVRRAGGHEQRAGHAAGGEGGPHDVAAEPPRRRIVRLRAVERGQVVHDREQDAGAARRIGWRERRQHGVRQCGGVADQQRAAAQRAHQQQRDAAAQPALLVAQREHERAADQPDGGAGEARERPVDGLTGDVEAGLGEVGRCVKRVARQHGHQRQSHHAHGGIGQRLGHQRRDHAGEDGEIHPGVLRHPSWRRQCGQHQRDRHRDRSAPPMERRSGRGSWCGESCGTLAHDVTTVNGFITCVGRVSVRKSPTGAKCALS